MQRYNLDILKKAKCFLLDCCCWPFDEWIRCFSVWLVSSILAHYSRALLLCICTYMYENTYIDVYTYMQVLFYVNMCTIVLLAFIFIPLNKLRVNLLQWSTFVNILKNKQTYTYKYTRNNLSYGPIRFYFYYKVFQ